MAQAIRQTELFAAEDWKVIYRAFTEVNFNAYDFDSIRESMIQYIRVNFPEDFNDWIESSEFVAIIDLLAYLGQSLAFRMDYNSRENFIDTAERRESILRLARLVSYNPRRNLPATGLVKIRQVMTDESIIDSNGVNLANLPITWNDPDNPDWFERWVLVMNAAFIKTNPYGRPVSPTGGTVGGIPTHLYELNNTMIPRGVFAFTATTGGSSLPFEIVNTGYRDQESFYELTPNPLSPFRIIYRNDGRGNQSSNTGFFMMFKQGSLRYQDFQLDIPLENRLIDIDADDINDLDVWVQEVNEQGFQVKEWTKVPAITGNNVIYNSIHRSVRDIFAVNTRERDQIAIRFADGRFGSVPTGLIRVWYRQSAGRFLDIRPQDMSGFTLTIPYLDGRGEPHNLALQFSLEYTVRNAQPRESVDAIRRRAPQTFYSNNRMINGEDYNILPLATNRAVKLKAINRTYSGHSRYLDLADPTGAHQNTNVYGDDGIIYREFENNFTEEPLPTSKDASEIISDRIVPFLQDRELATYFQWYYTTKADLRDRFSLTDPATGEARNGSMAVRWWRASNVQYSATGMLGVSDATPLTVGLLQPVGNPLHYVAEGAILKFRRSGWATVQTIRPNTGGLSAAGPGPITLNQAVDDGDLLQYVVPAFRTTFSGEELLEIVEEIRRDTSFGLRYDFEAARWRVIRSDYLDETGDYSTVWDGNFRTDSRWLIKMIRTPQAWQVTSRGLQYVFESKEDVRFFFQNRYKTIDIRSSLEVRDFVKVLRINPRQGTSTPLGRDITFGIADSYMYEDGFLEPRRVKIVPYDSDDDGAADNPLAFDEVVFGNRLDRPWETGVPQPGGLMAEWRHLCFWERYQDLDGYEYYRPLAQDRDIRNYDAVGSNPAAWTVGDVGYSIAQGVFYAAVLNPSDPTGHPRLAAVTDARRFMVREGRGLTWNQDLLTEDALAFQWRHYAPVDHRIDAAPTNIHDMFVLTTEYYREIQQWLERGGRLSDMPEPPTPEELHLAFAELTPIKSASDSLIWHPVKFKLLFGDSAPEELRCKFQVVRLPNSTLSDGEIKSRVIQAINEFFNVDNWDFGETFYYTDLATFIHQKLVAEIASVVPVPFNEEAKFGTLFQIKAESDELFLSTARVTDVQIVRNFTQTNLRIGR